jgi:hypothetical protein
MAWRERVSRRDATNRRSEQVMNIGPGDGSGVPSWPTLARFFSRRFAVGSTLEREADEAFDHELARLALAADPDTVVPDDAVPIWDIDGDGGALLPAWYMPLPMAVGRGGRRRRVVAIVVVAAFLAINAFGLCSTYGLVTLA